MALPEVSPSRHGLPASIQSVRRILKPVGCGLPATTLRDPAVAACVCARGLTVTVCGERELMLAQTTGVRPRQVVLRCGRDPAMIRRAVALGVARFVVSADRHVDLLAAGPPPDKHVFLDELSPVDVGSRRVEVVGMHCDIGTSPAPGQWGAAVERLLGRLASMRGRGPLLGRISLSGGSSETWLGGHTPQLRRMAAEVEDALDDGCARWRLPRPAMVLTPSTG
ncbi:hypothetical protein [Mycolicibacterium vaccae]|nr:hypothetical protein [Mycolicibacterium vaccae]MCV7063235.1 hypothetical protein [Mycolicibacterium vaccae]